MRKEGSWWLVPVAVVVGWGIALVDSSPGWDDTGITAGALFAAAAACGALVPKHAWRWAVAVGSWVPLLGIARHQNYGGLLALAFAFAGAYAGAFGRRIISESMDR